MVEWREGWREKAAQREGLRKRKRGKEWRDLWMKVEGRQLMDGLKGEGWRKECHLQFH